MLLFNVYCFIVQFSLLTINKDNFESRKYWAFRQTEQNWKPFKQINSDTSQIIYIFSSLG